MVLVEEEADEVVDAVDVEEDVVLVEEVGGVVLVEEEGNNFIPIRMHMQQIFGGIVQV